MAGLDEARASSCTIPSVTIVSAPLDTETLDIGHPEIDPSLASYLKSLNNGSLTGSDLLRPTSFLMPPPSETGYSSSGTSDVSSEISFDFSDNSLGTSLHQNEETRGRPFTAPHDRSFFSCSLSSGGPQITSTNIQRSTSADVSRVSSFGVVGAGSHLDYDISSVQMMGPDFVFIQAFGSATHAPSVDEAHSTVPWPSSDGVSDRGRRRHHQSHTSRSRTPSPYSRPRTSSMGPVDDLALPHFYRPDYIHNWREGISEAESSRINRWNKVPSHTTPEHIRLRERIIGSESWALDTLAEHKDTNLPGVQMAGAADNMNISSNPLLPLAASSQHFWPMGIPIGVEESQGMTEVVGNTRPSSNYLPSPTVLGQHPRPAETHTGVKASRGTAGTADNTTVFSNHLPPPTAPSQHFRSFGAPTGVEAKRNMAEALDNTRPSPNHLSHFRPFGAPTDFEARRSMAETICPSPNYPLPPTVPGRHFGLVEIPTGVEASRGMVGTVNNISLFSSHFLPPTALNQHFRPLGTPTDIEASRDIAEAPENTLLSSNYPPSSTAPTQHFKPVGTPAVAEASRRRRRNTVGGTVFKCTFKGCESTFTTRHNLKNHENSHMGIRPFICPKCCKDFTTKSTMTRHRDNVHNQK